MSNKPISKIRRPYHSEMPSLCIAAINITYKVYMAGHIHIVVFWLMTPCSLAPPTFDGKYCLHLQGMERGCFSETLVSTYQTKRCQRRRPQYPRYRCDYTFIPEINKWTCNKRIARKFPSNLNQQNGCALNRSRVTAAVPSD